MSSKLKRDKDSISDFDTSTMGCAIIWQDSIEIAVKITFSPVLRFTVEKGDNLKRVSNYFGRSRIMKRVLATLVALVVADGILSQFLVSYGLGREGNPFLQTFVEQDNFPLIKLAAALLCALILWDIYKTRPRVAIAGSLSFVALYTVLVYWNLGICLTVLV